MAITARSQQLILRWHLQTITSRGFQGENERENKIKDKKVPLQCT